MMRWVITKQLAAGPRPRNYKGHRGQVSRRAVDEWLRKIGRNYGIRSIICLLDEQHLSLYESLPTDLVSYYRAAGLAVIHIPAKNNQSPPLSQGHLRRVWNAYKKLERPMLIHCSVGNGRTAAAVSYVKQRMRQQGRPIAWLLRTEFT